MSKGLDHDSIREVVKLALLGADHRDVITTLIDRQFLQQSVEFLQSVAEAKTHANPDINDWYRERVVRGTANKAAIAWAAGTNLKTVGNKRGSQKHGVVVEESILHLDRFRDQVQRVPGTSNQLVIRLNVARNSVELNAAESWDVINALAVMRAGLRGGAWSSMGKQVEAPLMETLCRVFRVPETHFSKWSNRPDQDREVDFFLKRDGGLEAKCEVKLMGKGNPESADAVAARGINTFVASTLSAKVRKELDDNNVAWTELQTQHGLLRFQRTLGGYGIQHTPVGPDNVNSEVERALTETFSGVWS